MPDVSAPTRSPCDRCYAACCRQNGHEFAAVLQGDAERRRFAAYSVEATFVRADGSAHVQRVLPYVDGKCQFLGDDDRCTIYDDRPAACRQFECVDLFLRDGANSEFLTRNPRVLRLLQSG